MSQKFHSPGELVAYKKNYTEGGLWSKLASFGTRLGAGITTRILILYYVMTDGSVPIKDKAIVAGALGYLILPIDLVPDLVPVLGLTDDIAAIELAYNTVRAHVTDSIRRKAEAKALELFK